MIIKAIYDEDSDNPLETYEGFRCVDSYFDLDETFFSGDPVKDFVDASVYSAEKSDFTILSSSVDQFVWDCDGVLEWTPDEMIRRADSAV